MHVFPREARDLFFVPDTTNHKPQTNHKQTPKELEWQFFGDFGMGRAAEGAREAIFGGFWAGRDAEGAREAIFGGFWVGRDAEGAREVIFGGFLAGRDVEGAREAIF